MNLSHPVYPTRIVQHPFCNGGFSGINVCNNAYIAGPLEFLN